MARLERLDPSARMAVISGYASDELAIAAAAAGARRVMRKPAAWERLIEAVHSIAHDDDIVAPHPRLIRLATTRIDPRGLPVLMLRLDQRAPAEIADVLTVPINEVEVAIDRIVDTLKPRYWRPRRSPNGPVVDAAVR